MLVATPDPNPRIQIIERGQLGKDEEAKPDMLDEEEERSTVVVILYQRRQNPPLAATNNHRR